ncbi:MAG: serine/threonine protein phosphatase [Chloroflexi bacterium]|nr:serine/threonine protein phosphatase [Chloroflexota bacterium]
MSEKKCCSPNDISKNNRSIKQINFFQKQKHNSEKMILIDQGNFLMGTDYEKAFSFDGEGPIREIKVSKFYMDQYPVTNLDFEKFCASTGYITEAEKFGWSFVFYQLVSEKTKKNVSESVQDAPWWWKVDNANWKNPYGPDSNIYELENHPVVHVSWNDANAYASWMGKKIPTEAEWEIAARGGLVNKNFSWGDDDSEIYKKCNIWNGKFPESNSLKDGWLGTSPVDYFEPNDFNVYDTAGNVWEWCSDWFSASFHKVSNNETRNNPKGPLSGNTKTMKGGSYLCHNSYCNRYRNSARTQNSPDSSTGNLGFRLAYSD